MNAGGAFDLEQVRTLMRGLSRQAVDKRVQEVSLLAVPDQAIAGVIRRCNSMPTGRSLPAFSRSKRRCRPKTPGWCSTSWHSRMHASMAKSRSIFCGLATLISWLRRPAVTVSMGRERTPSAGRSPIENPIPKNLPPARSCTGFIPQLTIRSFSTGRGRGVSMLRTNLTACSMPHDSSLEPSLRPSCGSLAAAR